MKRIALAMACLAFSGCVSSRLRREDQADLDRLVKCERSQATAPGLTERQVLSLQADCFDQYLLHPAHRFDCFAGCDCDAPKGMCYP